MSKSTYGLRKAGLATLATTLVMGAGIAGAGSASAVADFKFDRIGGADRYETSTLVADEFAVTNTDVILANGEPGNYADALSANTLAGEMNAPILLTRKDKTPAFVLTQLQEDGVKNITVVGGPGVVSDAQIASLTSKGYNVTRVSGGDRFATNAEIIKDSGAATGNTGLIATGFNFPDALAAGPFSFQGHPLGLSTKDSIDDEVVNALKAAGVTKVLIFGGTTVVTPAVEAKLAANGITTAARFAGADRSDTSEQAAEYALANLGFSNKHLGVASGYVEGYGADALAGGPLEGKEKSPMLVTRDVNNPDDVVDFMKAHANTLETGHIYGGTAAVSASAQAAMEAAAKSVTSNQDYTVAQTAATNPTSATSGTTTEQNRGRREYIVTGLDDTKSYVIALFRAEDVTVDGSGVATFKDANVNDVADWTKTSAVIETVNNAAPTVADANGVIVGAQPVNGVLKFAIDSTVPDEVRPVIFQDADGGSVDATDTVDLDLDAKDQPTELFAVGGQKNWTAPESATTGNGADGTVGTVNKDANSFGIDTNGTVAVQNYDAAGVDTAYNYDANDTFAIEDAPATLAEFEAALSRGDYVVVGAYGQDDSLVSSFNIDADGATAGAATATAGTSGASVNDIEVVFDYGTPTEDKYYDAVQIERAPSVAGSPGTYAVIATAPIATDEDAVATTFTYTDENVAAGKYFYRVAGVIDGDIGAKDESNEVTSTTPGADTTGPIATYSALVQDGGFSGDVNTGDQLRFIFNEAMTIQSGDAIRVLEGSDATQAGSEERFTLTCGTNVTCALNAAPVVIGGKSYPANTVLSVTAGALTPDAAVTGGDATLSVPAFITNQSGVTDTAGNAWDLASSDRVINADASAPDMTAGTANATAETVTVTYSAPVDCANTAAVRAQFSYSAGGTPTQIACNGTSTVVLTFTDVTGTGNLTYTESASDASVRIRGLNGVEAASPETQVVS